MTLAGRVEESVWEERREWIGKQQESGLSVAQFCRDQSLREANFHALPTDMHKSFDGLCGIDLGTAKRRKRFTTDQPSAS